MTTKLTLSIDDEIISGAKKIAEEKQTSVSKLVSDYLKKLAGPPQKQKIKIEELAGILKTGKNLTEEEIDDIKWQHLKKKHGL